MRVKTKDAYAAFDKYKFCLEDAQKIVKEDSVRSTSSHSQQRLFRGEVLCLTQENAQNTAFSALI